MGLVKTRRLAAMQKQQRAKFGTPPPVKKVGRCHRIYINPVVSPRRICRGGSMRQNRDGRWNSWRVNVNGAMQ